MNAMFLKCFAALGLLGAAACTPSTPPAEGPAAPATAAGAMDTAPVARVAPPEPMPLEPVNFPPFQEFPLANGLKVLVVEKHDQPVANVDLYVGSGAAADPSDHAGLAELSAALLTQGTAKRSATEIAETIEGVGGSLNAFATDDYVRVSANVLSDQLPLAMDLVSDVAQRPTFPAQEVETARKRELSSLQASLAQAAVLADRQFLSEIYGPQHPYGRVETPTSIGGISRTDVVGFHRVNFKAGNALLVVSGDVDVARVREMAQRYFGGWAGGSAQPVAFVEPPAQGSREVVFVHRPGSAQSNILVGHTGIRPDNPDYFPLQVMNKILGSGADARLFLILREQKGWTYGAYSRLSRPKDIGYFSATAEVRNEVTDSALVEMMSQLRRIREEPVTPQELESAKSFLTGSFPLRIETPGQIARQVADVRLLGVPIEYLTDYRERIAAVTAQDVQRVAQKYVRPDQATVVVVGDATQVLGNVEALGLGPVSLVSVGGAPLDRSAIEVRASTERYDASRLQPMTRTYQVLVQGNAAGTATMTLARAGETWTGGTKLQVGPVNQQTEVRFSNDFTPVTATQNMVQGPVTLSTDLSFSNNRVTGTAKLPEQLGGDKTIDSEVVQGTLLDGMEQYVIAVADLQPGRSITLPIFNAATGSVAPQTFKVAGTEEVTVPAGTFQSYRIEVSGGQTGGTMWVRQDAPHVLIKQELAGQPISIVLQKM